MDLGIALGVLGIVVTIALGLLPLWRRTRPSRWSEPVWSLETNSSGGRIIPVLAVRWALHGKESVQAVECAVLSPGSDWRRLSWPTGRVDPPKDNLYTYIDLINGKPFNATVTSLADIRQPVQDLTDQAVKGRYELRIRWVNASRPGRTREKTYSHTVT